MSENQIAYLARIVHVIESCFNFLLIVELTVLLCRLLNEFFHANLVEVGEVCEQGLLGVTLTLLQDAHAMPEFIEPKPH